MALDFPASPVLNQTFQSGNQVWTFNGTAWTSGLASSVYVRQSFTATAGQTTFAVSGGYQISLVDVYHNGVKLVNGTDVTVTSGTDVVLTTGASAGDVIEVLGLASIATLTYLPLTGGTVTGDVTVPLLNVGNDSDTTITRSAAGVLAVEGGIIPKENRANTFTAAQTINANAANVLTISNGLSGGTPSSTHGELVIDSADANIGMQILGSTTSNQRILFGDTDANSRGQIEYAHSFDTMTLYTAGTSRLSINGSGNIGLGGTALAIASVYVPREITGGTTAYSIYNRNTIMSDVTASAVGIFSNITTDAASFTLTTLYHFAATQNTLGAGSAVTTQAGFYAYGTLRDATTNYSFHAANTATITTGKTSYGFYSAINIATGGGETWAFYGAGTAPSLFAGSVIVGTAPSNDNVNFFVNKAVTGLAATSYGSVFQGLVQSDVTGSAIGILAQFGTAAASFTLTNLYQFRAAQNTFGASSSVTTQMGFYSDTTLIGATSNYGFYAGNTAAVTSGKTAYGFSTNMAIATGGGTTWAFYASGTAWSFFNGPVILDDVHWQSAPAPTAKSAAATLTGAEVKTKIITCTGTSYTLTMPTGTNLDAAFSGIPANVNIGFDISFVNNASGTVTVAVNTGITSSGTLTIATGTSASFRLRRTAANTYVLYRL